MFVVLFFFFKQKTAYEMRISDWSSDVCSSDLIWSWNMVARWEAGTKKPAPRGAGPFVFPLKNRSAEERPHPDTRINPAFVDHLDRDIDDHGEADVGDPAVALDIFGDDEIGRASCRERVCQSV